MLSYVLNSLIDMCGSINKLKKYIITYLHMSDTPLRNGKTTLSTTLLDLLFDIFHNGKQVTVRLLTSSNYTPNIYQIAYYTCT